MSKLSLLLLFCSLSAFGYASVIPIGDVLKDIENVEEKLFHFHGHFHHGGHHIHVHFHHGHIHIHYHYHHHPPSDDVIEDFISKQRRELEGERKLPKMIEPPQNLVVFGLIPTEDDHFMFSAANDSTTVFAEEVDPSTTPEVCGSNGDSMVCARVEDFKVTPTGYSACVQPIRPTADVTSRQCFNAKLRTEKQSGEMSFIWF